jgi:HTH-type transcriptional regulator / antitoxin HigA
MLNRIAPITSDLAVVRDDLQYASYLEEARSLIKLDPPRDSKEGLRLELISFLIEKYESGRYPVGLPDAVSAILFRMTELGLKQKDFGEIIGSESRASEILSRRRALSLDMIRKIHHALRIPAEVLISKSEQPFTDANADLEWDKFPIKEMIRRGWISGDVAAIDPAGSIKQFIRQVSADLLPVFLRRSVHGAGAGATKEMLCAWLTRVVFRARETKTSVKKYEQGSLTEDFLTDVAKLSATDLGPLVARDFLARRGIALIIEPSLPRMKIDGAAILDEDGMPIIGISLRFDRLDSFWFTLAHELAHVVLHLEKHNTTFVDNTEGASEEDRLEQEANVLASESYIPRSVWRYSAAGRTRSAEAIKELANQLCINPAVIAGRIRRESNNYRILGNLLGTGQVRKLFSEVTWR